LSTRPLILLSYYFIEKNNLKNFILFGVLACLTKESVFPVYFMFGIYIYFFKRKLKNHKLKGLSVSIISLLSFTLITEVIIPLIFRHGIWLHFKRIKQSPLTSSDLVYLKKFLAPLLFLPLFSYKIIPALPIIFQNFLLPDSARDFHIYHNTLIIPFLYISIAHVVNFIFKQKKFGRTIGYLVLIALLFLHSNSIKSFAKDLAEKNFGTYNPDFSDVKALVQLVPKDETLITHYRLLPIAATRKNLYWFKGFENESISQDFILYSPKYFSQEDNASERIVNLDKDGFKYIQINHIGNFYLLKKSK